ncbi:transmembrane protein 184F [Dictyostelium discoideum AX4]|uniref:Transmembrane protein 184F n=2 Tax=Dictyostelium discoideum TaxID=44689 RepID=B0G149_DICDI|nr:transmembrane protein 184F [Dictyostelium discoideum AX4]EDR41060.1 transmembrane protein 184F [Dictyostelium discoideum AX4]|eukprot:XP_001733011.1 transmembrane protein 184F [Dictyostelium discoideum AX4]
MLSHINIIYIIWILLFFFTCLISFFLVNRHLVNYSSPNVQKNVVRIVMFLPLNSGLSILSSIFPGIAIFNSLVRNCYMAFTAHCFFSMMTNSIGEKNMLDLFESQGKMKFLCCKVMKLNRKLFNTLRFGSIQFFIVKIFCSIATITCISISEEVHSILNVQSFAPYEFLISLVASIFCTISLSIFLAISKEKLSQYWPMTKYRIMIFIFFIEQFEYLFFALIFLRGPFFLGFKNSFDQTIFILHFTVVVTMFLFSIVYLFIYSYKNYRNKASNEPLVGRNFKDSFGLLNYLDVLNPKDLFIDFASIFKTNNNKFKELVEENGDKKPKKNIEDQNQENSNDQPLSIQMA